MVEKVFSRFSRQDGQEKIFSSFSDAYVYASNVLVDNSSFSTLTGDNAQSIIDELDDAVLNLNFVVNSYIVNNG